MCDKERYYNNWICYAHNWATFLDQGIGMDSEALTVISFLSETDKKKQKVCVGQAQSA